MMLYFSIQTTCGVFISNISIFIWITNAYTYDMFCMYNKQTTNWLIRSITKHFFVIYRFFFLFLNKWRRLHRQKSVGRSQMYFDSMPRQKRKKSPGNFFLYIEKVDQFFFLSFKTLSNTRERNNTLQQWTVVNIL